LLIQSLLALRTIVDQSLSAFNYQTLLYGPANDFNIFLQLLILEDLPVLLVLFKLVCELSDLRFQSHNLSGLPLLQTLNIRKKSPLGLHFRANTLI
jgi:hypothetical protein